MNDESEDSPKHEVIDFDFDVLAVDTQHAISATRHYLELMEQQMPVVQVREMGSLEAERPSGNDEEEQSLYLNRVADLERLFEEDLIPTMRYSFIVFLHTVLETQLQNFCIAMQRERNLPLKFNEVRGRGRGIEQAGLYIEKLVGIGVRDFDEWKDLVAFQTVRNYIVHRYGDVDSDRDDRNKILELARRQVGLSITHKRRIALDASFCELHLAHVQTFFKRLFMEAGS